MMTDPVKAQHKYVEGQDYSIALEFEQSVPNKSSMSMYYFNQNIFN
jgi:hypothetical protein